MRKKQQNSEKTTIPLPVLVGEIRMMYSWCQTDKCELVSNGLKWEIVESLPALCDNSETLSINCKIERISLSEYRKSLKNKFLVASQKRALISKKIRYALSIANSDNKIQGYYRRRTYPEIIGDLFNLAALCGQLKDVLEITGFNQTWADSLKQLSLELQNDNVALSDLVLDYKDLRKAFLCAYHELYTSAQTIRNCAFEVFEPDSLRRQGYHSHYRKNHK